MVTQQNVLASAKSLNCAGEMCILILKACVCAYLDQDAFNYSSAPDPVLPIKVRLFQQASGEIETKMAFVFPGFPGI